MVDAVYLDAAGGVDVFGSEVSDPFDLDAVKDRPWCGERREDADADGLFGEITFFILR